MAETRWVALGQVLRPHGIRGELRVHLHNEESRTLEPGLSISLRPTGAEPSLRQSAVVERARYVPGGLLLKVAGVDTREAADLLRGAAIEIQRESFPSLASGEYYACDLVGAKVFGPEGLLGTVREVATYPSADALVVELQSCGSGAVEIPLIDDFIAAVDIAEHVVRLESAALSLLSRP